MTTEKIMKSEAVEEGEVDGGDEDVVSHSNHRAFITWLFMKVANSRWLTNHQ